MVTVKCISIRQTSVNNVMYVMDFFFFQILNWILVLRVYLILQKALLIVVAVVDQLGGALGESGLLVLPCVAAHINQVFLI